MTLRWFDNWLVEQESIERSPMAKLWPPKTRKGPHDRFSTDDLEHLAVKITAAGDGQLTSQDRAIAPCSSISVRSVSAVASPTLERVAEGLVNRFWVWL